MTAADRIKAMIEAGEPCPFGPPPEGQHSCIVCDCTDACAFGFPRAPGCRPGYCKGRPARPESCDGSCGEGP